MKNLLVKSSTVLALGFTLSAHAANFVVHTLPMNVFRTEKREKVTKPNYPYRAVGRVFADGWDGTNVCTGVLVGRDLVLTNMHCMTEFKDRIFSFEAFAQPDGKSIASSRVKSFVAVERDAVDGRVQYNAFTGDWTILLLEKPLGDKLGWFDVMEIEGFMKENSTQKVQMASYPSDNASPASKIGGGQMYKENCSIRAKGLLGDFLHDCSTSHGSSGAPLFFIDADGIAVIVGLHAGGRARDKDIKPGETLTVDEYDSDYANRAVSAKFFKPSIDHLKALKKKEEKKK